MTVQDGVIFACSLAVVLGGRLSVRDRLRMKPPKVRVAAGGAGICLAVLAFFVLVRVLPKLDEIDNWPIVDAIVIAICSLAGGLLVFSIIESGGGAVQGFKRWRYFRRNVH